MYVTTASSFLGLICLARVCLGVSDYSPCSDVIRMYEHCSDQSTGRETGGNTPTGVVKVIKGRTGKSGPTGSPGPRGKPGQVNYTVVDEKLEETQQEILAKVEEKLSKYERVLNETREAVDQILTEKETRMNKILPKDCMEVSKDDAKIWLGSGGVFDIFPKSEKNSLEVYCDLATDGGGWTVFQRRMDGSVDFLRGWIEYVNGFGYKDKEMWLGLEAIYELTKDGRHELRVDMGDWQGNVAHAHYDSFSISDGSDNYRLTVREYSGDAGDSITPRHQGMPFSTRDKDLDSHSLNCAETHRGAWWYSNCHHSNLNGYYYKGGNYRTGSYGDGVVWYHWKGNWYYSLKFTEMKFRKKT